VSLEHTQVPRRETDRLTVPRLVTINPQSAKKFVKVHHQENPSTTISDHQEVNPRASSSLSAHIASSSESSRKRGREEDDDDESRRRQLIKVGTALARVGATAAT
jgi:hypothetical protein